MSDPERPARVLADALEMPLLALFVNMRTLVEETDPQAIMDLERGYGVTQRQALDYFRLLHPWEQNEAGLDDLTEAAQDQMIRSRLKRSHSQSVLTLKPEA